ncbi:hypothetical protein M3558_07875 [Brevibacillus invocatus]|uniref:hypothetical protein n=1 Tax=Brevibacillus invocatus TaxID=173959 RepID=UPI00203D4E16|nr:hypothetical protein [Brevibacillus invocatus]MCM3079010.1 hypothetical protein [Brevibacillus invocatus]
MKKLAKLAVISASLSIALLSSSAYAYANDILGTGEDYNFSGYGSYIHDRTATTAYLWAYTEGEGADRNKVRVESDFYMNGSLVKSTGANRVTYIDLDYDAKATRINSLKVTSNQYVYNKVNEYKRKTSQDSW